MFKTSIVPTQNQASAGFTMKVILFGIFFTLATGSEHECGRQKLINNLVVASKAEPVEFPWLVQLRYTDKSGNEKLACAGSLINRRYVLTTAVCAQTPLGAPTKATLGEYYTKPDEYDDYQRQNVGIDRVIVHNDYNEKMRVHDIALLELNAEVNFTDYIQPICLPFNKESRVGDLVAASGWGALNRSTTARSKKKVISSIIDNDECDKLLKNSVKIADTHLCTKRLDGNIEATCAGDSGGPVVSLNDGKWYQQGIVSFGGQCGSATPDGNTNVAKYLDWITENIK